MLLGSKFPWRTLERYNKSHIALLHEHKQLKMLYSCLTREFWKLRTTQVKASLFQVHTYKEVKMRMLAQESVELIPRVDINDVKVIRLLGSGGFGSVFEAIHNNCKVALKKFHTNTRNKKAAMQSFEAEMHHEVLSLKHPNIVKVLAANVASSLEDQPCIIMEFVSTRNLQHVIDDAEEKIDFKRRVKFAYEVATALEYVHENSIAHLDLKPANVLVTQEGNCKLADFGCCQIIQERPNTPSRSYLTGTFAYRAPELLKGESPTFKADVFSFGICLWQFWTREIPYKLQNHQIVIFRVVACNLRPEIPEGNDVDNRYRELMTSSWSGSPEDRPTMAEVVNLLKGLA